MDKLFWVVLLSAVVAGCGDTQQAIDEMERQTSAARLKAAKNLAERLQDQPQLLAQGDIQVFMSSKLIGEALKLFDGFEIQVPGRKDVTVKVVSMVPALSEGIAAIDLDLLAAHGDLKLEVKGLATFIPQPLRPAKIEVEMRHNEFQLFGIPMSGDLPSFTLRKSEPMKFKLVVERLAPRANWGPFSTDIKGFVAELAQLKINQVLNEKLPLIEAPIENIIKIDQPAQQHEFPLKDGAYIAGLTTPPVSWATTFNLEDVVVLPRGIHLIGNFSNAEALK
jgi:hypothetical protein